MVDGNNDPVASAGNNPPTFQLNKDGSVDLPVEGKPTRFVKETDLLAVKGGAESRVKEWEAKETKFNTDLAEANRLREEEHQNLLKAQAAHEQLATQYKDYDAVKTRAGELEKEVNSHKERLTKHETELAERIKTSLINHHGASAEALKDKTLDQLRTIEEAAKVFGGNGKGGKARYDGGSGGPSGGNVETPSDRAKRILEEHEAKGHRIGAHSAPPAKQ